MKDRIMQHYNLPLASKPFISYRYDLGHDNQQGYVMIGALSHADALNQAQRSITTKANIKMLEVWNGKQYVKVK